MELNKDVEDILDKIRSKDETELIHQHWGPYVSFRVVKRCYCNLYNLSLYGIDNPEIHNSDCTNHQSVNSDTYIRKSS